MLLAAKNWWPRAYSQKSRNNKIAPRFYYSLTFQHSCPLNPAMLTELEKKVIACVQGDLSLSPQPYDEIASQLGVSVEQVLETLQSLCDRGVIRRFGATLRHQKSGFTANAMVAWKVPGERVDTVGEIFAGFGEVSHCYHRNPAKDWPYNLYTMVHATDEDACHGIASEMSAKAQVQEYTLLFSRKELKKTSMQYFTEEQR